jgi:hypothetical protein
LGSTAPTLRLRGRGGVGAARLEAEVRDWLADDQLRAEGFHVKTEFLAHVGNVNIGADAVVSRGDGSVVVEVVGRKRFDAAGLAEVMLHTRQMADYVGASSMIIVLTEDAASTVGVFPERVRVVSTREDFLAALREELPSDLTGLAPSEPQ